jgi:hypothetical protein
MLSTFLFFSLPSNTGPEDKEVALDYQIWPAKIYLKMRKFHGYLFYSLNGFNMDHWKIPV